jgi:hypothetical protein
LPENKYFVHHDIIGTCFYLLAKTKNSASESHKWIYSTGGIGYRLNKKTEIQFDYLIFQKEITSNTINYLSNGSSIVLRTTNYTALKHSYSQIYFWSSLKRYILLKKNNYLFFNAGFGGGTNNYKNNNSLNSVIEKNREWCNVFDIGYTKAWRNFSISPFLGVLSSFAFQKQIQYQKKLNYSATDIYNIDKPTNNDLKKVTIIDSNQVIRYYNFAGIMQSTFILRVGFDILIRF